MKLNIKISTAIDVLKKNQAIHIGELKEATDEWVRLVMLALEKFRDAVDRRGLQASHEELSRLFHMRPQDNRAEYSKMLGAMGQAQVDGQSHVEVDEDDYDRIFMDNWDWRIRSKTANSAYTKVH